MNCIRDRGSGGRTKTEFFELPTAFKLRSGDLLPRVRLAYELYGEINSAADNLVLVFAGIEHIEDIKEDLDQALAAVA